MLLRKPFDRTAEIRAQRAQALGAEEHDHDGQDDE
jgi:hypothetical protein